MIKTYVCDWCEKPFYRRESYTKGKKHLFCSRQCLADFSNKSKNPDGYKNLRNTEAMSLNMTRINKRLNPTRMTMEVRKKLREHHLSLPAKRTETYAKYHSKHEHRVIAEAVLGRELRDDEVVHHIDGNIRNNSLDNLAVMSKRDHSTYHSRMNAFWFSMEVKVYDKAIIITPLSKI